MPTINTREKQDKNSNSYYLIIDQETDNAYFCFSGAVKEGWDDLVQNWQEIKEIEIEYVENELGNEVLNSFINYDNKKVISVFCE